MANFTLSEVNQEAVQMWTYLDLTGRSRGMQEEPLREEAIDAILTRFGINTPTVYSRIIRIESEIFPFKQEQNEKKRDQDRKKREIQQKAQTRQVRPSRPPSRRR